MTRDVITVPCRHARDCVRKMQEHGIDLLRDQIITQKCDEALITHRFVFDKVDHPHPSKIGHQNLHDMHVNVHKLGTVKATDFNLENREEYNKFMQVKFAEMNVQMTREHCTLTHRGQPIPERTHEELVASVACYALRACLFDFYTDEEPKWVELRRYLCSEEPKPKEIPIYTPEPITPESEKDCIEQNPVFCSWGEKDPFSLSYKHDTRPLHTFVNLMMIGKLDEFTILQNTNGYSTYNRCYYRIKGEGKIWQEVPMENFKMQWRQKSDWPYFADKYQHIYNRMKELYDLHLVSYCRIDAIAKLDGFTPKAKSPQATSSETHSEELKAPRASETTRSA